MMHFTTGNQIKLLRNGTEYFPELEDAIANAQHEIYLQTYIYQTDSVGIRIGNALKLAALRGVVVNVLLDGFDPGGAHGKSRIALLPLELPTLGFLRPRGR